MEQVADGLAVQTVGGPLMARLSFSLDRRVSLVSHLTEGEPVPDGLEQALRQAYADVLVLDHGLFAAAWQTPEDDEALLAEHDRLVKAVSEVYAPGRIVLLRTAIPRFVWRGNAVRPRRYRGTQRDVDAVRRFTAALDARFAQATGCIVVDEAVTHLPVRAAAAHGSALGEHAVVEIEKAVLAAARAGAPTALPQPADGSLAGVWAGDGGFAAALHGELVAGPVEPERVLELLPGHGLDTHEDAAALAAAVAARPKADWSAVAETVLASRGGLAAAMQQRFAANLRVLRDYPHVYLRREALDCAAPPGRLVARLHLSWFLVIDASQPRPVSMRNYGRRGEFDPQAFCDGGYVCPPDQIDVATESWEAYFERGRRGDTAPFRIAFANRAGFQRSLEFLDYADILANENYCLTINGKLPDRVDWQPRVDTGFLFDPRTRVCVLTFGFGNQLLEYMAAARVTRRHGLRLFLDDLHFDNPRVRLADAHSRPDLVGLAESGGAFSQVFSERLRRRSRPFAFRPFDYSPLGLREQVVILDAAFFKGLLARGVRSTAILAVPATADQAERCIVSPPPGVPFVSILQEPLYFPAALADAREKAVWERAIAWRGFVSDAAAAVAQRMLATDAVVVHIRRGDRARRGQAHDEQYYHEFLENVAALDEYSNKELFVFSDDLDYCRAYRDELGLDLTGGPVTFVEGNRHFASVDDFHLMTLGKIIVCGVSSFSATAALASSRAEYVFRGGWLAGPDLAAHDGMWRRPAPAPSGADDTAPAARDRPAARVGPAVLGRLRRRGAD